MENLVGDIVPTEKEVLTLVKDILALDDRVKRFANLHLSPEQRRALPRFRPGAEPIVALVARLAEDKSVQLAGQGISGMKSDLLLAQRMQPLASASEQLQKRIDDGRLEAEGECWSSLTGYYSVLQTMAARDPVLAQQLKPATDFFATGRRAKAAKSAA